MVVVLTSFEIINNKARHNLIDAKCRWRSDWRDGSVSFWELLGQIKSVRGDTKPQGGKNL